MEKRKVDLEQLRYEVYGILNINKLKLRYCEHNQRPRKAIYFGIIRHHLRRSN